MNSWISLLVVSLVIQASMEGQTEDRIITLDLTSTHNGELFYSKLTTGLEGYEQTFNMLVSTSYPTTHIYSWRIHPIRGYRPGPNVESQGHLRYTKGTGARYEGHPYYIYYDRVKLGSQAIDRQPIGFVVLSRTDNGLEANIDGMLGLNYGVKHGEDDVYFPIENLYKLKHINHLRYSLYTNNTAVASRLNGINEDSQSEGALVLGGVDERYYSGQFRYVQLNNSTNSDGQKSIIISNIRLDWSRVNTGDLTDSIARQGSFDIDIEPKILKLDSSMILFVGDQKTLDIIHIGIMGADPILRGSFYAFKDCRLDNKPDIVFSLKGGFDITITPEDYVIEHELHDRKVCLSAFKPSGKDVWSFGTRFMRKYYILFDEENARIGFAEPT